jgi:Contractile injection system tube protein/LysM domain
MPGSRIALSSGSTAAAGRSSMTRGRLEMFAATPATDGQGGVKRGAGKGAIEFQFNPKEMSIAKSASWGASSSKRAGKAPPSEFKGAEPCKLTLELFFDATDTFDSSVLDRVEKVFACLVPPSGDANAWPPLVELHWGEVTSFLGYVAQVQAKYTLFAPNGTPVRATCSLTVQEMREQNQKQNPTSGTYVVHAEHTLLQGETLASIAYREYGDPQLWRALADFNEIDDPLRVRPGTVLIVPELTDLLAAASVRGRDRGLLPAGAG